MTDHRSDLSRLSRGEIVYDVMSHRKRWYVITGVVLLVCILGLFVRGLNFSIDFSGGSEFRVSQAVTDTTVSDARQVVEEIGLPDLTEITVRTIGSDTVTVQTRTLADQEVTQVRDALGSWAGVPSDQVSYSLIGASWGEQITQKGIIALTVFLVLVALLIAAYFRDWRMSVAAIAAVAHDLLVTVGIYAWVGFSVTPATLTAILTILGYSLYDTLVVFDRVKENVADLSVRKETYAVAANRSLNEVLLRSINTTIIAVLPIVALLIAGVFVLGTGPIKDLSLAMVVGMIAGAYSSIFIATSLLVDIKERSPQMVRWSERLSREQERTVGARRTDDDPDAPPVTLAVDLAEDDTEGDGAPAVATPVTAVRHQPQHRPRSQRGHDH